MLLQMVVILLEIEQVVDNIGILLGDVQVFAIIPPHQGVRHSHQDSQGDVAVRLDSVDTGNGLDQATHISAD